jgi:low affinity Fe/Cu permease
MSKYIHYIQKRFNDLKAKTRELISAEKQETDNPFIELDAETYEKLKEIADTQESNVEAILNQAVENYIAIKTNQPELYITMEQRENNPILNLDNLCQTIN